MKMESLKEFTDLIIVPFSLKRCFTQRNNNENQKLYTKVVQMTTSELNFEESSWLFLFNHLSFFFPLNIWTLHWV